MQKILLLCIDACLVSWRVNHDHISIFYDHMVINWLSDILDSKAEKIIAEGIKSA